MSLKILIDLIPSFSTLRRCSSMAKAKLLIEEALAQEKDWFFYWLLPPDLSDEDRAWLPKTDRLRIIPYPYFVSDRMREYQLFRMELDDILAFNGIAWDFDAYVTSRTAMLPTARACMSAPRQMRRARMMKQVIVIEELEPMAFRPAVSKGDLEALEVATVAGYLCADHITIQTDRERAGILNCARGYLSPSRVREIDGLLQNVMPFALTHMEEKAPEHRYDGARPFNVNFSGRLEMYAANLAAVYRAMDTAWIKSAPGKMRVTINTVSRNKAYVPPDAVELRVTDREEFWHHARTDMDVQLVLHKDAEFSLTLIEPMMLGVPLIVLRHAWAHEVYGRDYPYQAKDEAEALAWVKEAMRDYPAFYARFLEWREGSFRPALETGRYSRLMTPSLIGWLAAHEAKLHSPVLTDRMREHADNVHMVRLREEARKWAKEKGSFTLFELLEKTGQFPNFADKLGERDRDTRRLAFATGWNDLRLILKSYEGFRDASTATGHLTL